MSRTLLTERELKAIAGGITPFTPKTVLALDKYGDTLSIEEWMNWVLIGNTSSLVPKENPGNEDPFGFPGGAGRR